MRIRTIGMAVTLVASCAGPLRAQGVPVIDFTSIAKQIEQLAEAQKQLQVLNDQLQQAQKLHGSLNRLTNMGDIASVLNNPAIRQALPKEFTSAEKLLMGQGGAADAHRQQDEVFTPGGNSFYAQELRRSQEANAGQKSVGEQIYAAAGQRLSGIEGLRQQINQSEDPKTVMDLQARIGVEQAHIQNDLVKMQGLRMVQQAELQVQEQRQRESFQRRLDDSINSVRGGGSISAPSN